MKTMAFLTQKGGSGKTTLAVHIAVAAQEDGQQVVIVDTDQQRSATAWHKARHADMPPVAPVAASELEIVLKAAHQDGITLCIVDTAPHAAPDALHVARVADLVVIPCRPAAFDLAAVGGTVEIVKAAGTPRAVFVLSACPVRAPEIREARAALSGYGLPVAPVAIMDRRAFARAVAMGQSVTEFEGRGKAAREIRALWHWVKEQTG